MGTFRVSTRLLALIRTAILARLLSPTQFGAFGIAALFLALVEIFTETGINVFLIQEKAAIGKFISTAWIVSILRGVLIAVAIIILAPLVSLFFNSPEALTLVLLISLVPLLRGFINPAIARFQKELQFGKEFWFRFGVFSFDSLVAIFLAFWTREVSSLVWGFIAGAGLEVLLSFLVVKPKPKLVFEPSVFKQVVKRGKWITAAGIFKYLFQHGDDAVVGKILGTSSLGLYQMVYRISTLPITEVADVVSRVTFPIYVKISTDSQRLRIAFLKTTLGIFFLVLPPGLVLLFFPKEIILFILGPQWVGGSSALQILSIFGMIQAISSSTSALFLALKKQEFVTIVTLTSILGLALTVIPLTIKFGLVGAGISALIGSLVALPVIIYYSFRVLRVS